MNSNQLAPEMGASIGVRLKQAREAAGLSQEDVAASLKIPVKGIRQLESGNNYLKSAAFPEASFVSSAFRPMSSRRGKVDGQLTLMGKAKPVTFDVELVGAGKGFADRPRLGANARGSINPVDFGLPPLFGDAIEIVIDVEFQREP